MLWLYSKLLSEFRFQVTLRILLRSTSSWGSSLQGLTRLFRADFVHQPYAGIPMTPEAPMALLLLALLALMACKDVCCEVSSMLGSSNIE